MRPTRAQRWCAAVFLPIIALCLVPACETSPDTLCFGHATCPSVVDDCRDISTWCTSGIYLWPRAPQDVAEYGVEPRCFCMCDSNDDCAPKGSLCDLLLKQDSSGETRPHFPDHTWYGGITFMGGEPKVCLTDTFTPAPALPGCF